MLRFLWIILILIPCKSNARLMGFSKPENPQTDLIIFSFDRPLQLYALLESCYYYLQGIANTYVIYRTSNERFSNAYIKVQEQFANVQFLKQGADPASDFKPLVMQAFYSGSSQYILFAVDDIIVKNYADLTVCTRALEACGAYGFFLRLAPHLDYCYPLAQPQPLPPLAKVDTNTFLWIFEEGQLDWGYPNTVDMTIYRKSDIQNDLQTISFRNPNTLEAKWAGKSDKVLTNKGLCFKESIVVNIPINIVQKDCRNRSMFSWTPEELLDIFEQGGKIDFMSLKGMINKSCHIDYVLKFIQQITGMD